MFRCSRCKTLTLLALLPVLGVLSLTPAVAEHAVKIPTPAKSVAAHGGGLQTTVLAGGCFWGMQAVFQHVKGVTDAVSGYTGGAARDAHYEIVSTGRTGHAESVKITYDPKRVSFGRLLQVYFSVAHNPTELDYQGPDHGTQYRSEIFPQTQAQRAVAMAYIAQLDAAHVFPRKIVTKVDSATATFYPAEGYHQDYAVHHPNQPYIAYNDAPKVANLKRMFPKLWRSQPVTVAEAEAKGQ